MFYEAVLFGNKQSGDGLQYVRCLVRTQQLVRVLKGVQEVHISKLPFRSLLTHNHLRQPHPPDTKTQKCFLKLIPIRRDLGDGCQELFESMKIERITYFVRRIRKGVLTIKFCKNNKVIIFQEASPSQLAVRYEVIPPPGYTSVAIARLIKPSSN